MKDPSAAPIANYSVTRLRVISRDILFYSPRPESLYAGLTLRRYANRPIATAENVTCALSQSEANAFSTCLAHPMNWAHEVCHMVVTRHVQGFELDSRWDII